MNYPKKTGFNLYHCSRHCAYIIYNVKTWFLKILSVSLHILKKGKFFSQKEKKCLECSETTRIYATHPFQAFLVSKTYILIHVKQNCTTSLCPLTAHSLICPLKGSRKKSSSLNDRAIKALPPPLGLNGHRNFFFSLFFK